MVSRASWQIFIFTDKISAILFCMYTVVWFLCYNNVNNTFRNWNLVINYDTEVCLSTALEPRYIFANKNVTWIND